MRRILLSLACVLLFGALAAVACGTTARRSEPHPALAGLWRELQAMPRERALALAGDPDALWVAGASGGHASQIEADQSALEQCRRRRVARRLQAPCLLYARGDKIVWKAR